MLLQCTRCLQNSKFTYLSNAGKLTKETVIVCRIQNLHISQTLALTQIVSSSFVEFKIYISLKQTKTKIIHTSSFVEFKIYISLKQTLSFQSTNESFVEFKIYISLKLSSGLTCFHFCLQNSKFTYLSNLKLRFRVEILNLGIKKWTDTDPGPKAIQIKSLFELECKF